ncbi:hypothetical protein HXZ94_09345 [Empedobacter falsenii]|uniref:hypothetical protein n=1 Tax=Empedobacter falsenii TaxID=343874 RepID=UPI002574CD3F|nr:hypothetical protein [Empedobacter falsenii]MDM1298707.1 hypothetical protein [Empedobacter falsenii]MDM1318500.1 hypothetical protein [Empedobacter falsenii]
MKISKSRGFTSQAKKLCQILLSSLVLIILNTTTVKAEGSRDLYPTNAVGNRAFLMSRVCVGCAYNPFPTIGRQYVYAKEGETIYTGSSTASEANRIKVYSPTGKLYTSTGTMGLINNRVQELAGPNITGVTTSGYTPYSVSVPSGETGIWVIEFYSNGTDTTQTNMIVKASDEWSSIQTTLKNAGSAFIATWDVTVANGTTIKNGRVYMNVFNASINTASNTATSGFFGKFYALTKDGFVYRIDNNGQNGYSFNNFVNNKGTTYYQTEAQKNDDKGLSQGKNYSTVLWDPRKLDGYDDNVKNINTNGDNILNITHKMFYQAPSTELPEKAAIFWSTGDTSNTTWSTTGSKIDIWLKPIRRSPDLQSMHFEGVEGTLNTAGLKGGYFVFNSHVIGEYTITIPIASSTITLKGQLELGENKVHWDGKDSSGNYILENGVSLTDISVAVSGAEVHFPFLDVESNYNGIYIELLDENMNLYSPTRDIVYWNLATKPTNVVQKNLTGLSSTSTTMTNRLYWQDGTSGSTGFGNDKAINIWANVQDSHTIQNGPQIIYRSSDLQVTAINKTKGPAKYYSGALSEYTVDIINSGNLENENDFAPTFMLFLPNGTEINLNDIKFTSTNGSTLVQNSAEVIKNIVDSDLGVTVYKVKINMPINGDGKFIIPVKIGQNNTNNRFNAWATILRAKDTRDPNATNPDLTITPTDPFLEANGLFKNIANLNLNNDFTTNKDFIYLVDTNLPTTSPNYTNNIKVLYTEILNNVCTQPGNFTENGVPTIVGINTQTSTLNGWPEHIPNGFITMETTNKGFSITRVPNASTIVAPLNGMIVYDISAKCIKLYRNNTWNCITRTCNN